MNRARAGQTKDQDCMINEVGVQVGGELGVEVGVQVTPTSSLSLCIKAFQQVQVDVGHLSAILKC